MQSYAVNSPILEFHMPEWPWRCRSRSSITERKQALGEIHIWYKFGGSVKNLWKVMLLTRPKRQILQVYVPQWDWRCRSRSPITERKQALGEIHIWCKFGGSAENLWKVMLLTRPKWPILQVYVPQWPWRWRSRSPITERKQAHGEIHIWCKFGGSAKNLWKVMLLTRPKWSILEIYVPKWPWRCRSRSPISERKQAPGEIHIWCKFGVSVINLRKVMLLTVSRRPPARLGYDNTAQAHWAEG
jgi:hypothetical protein